MEQGVCHVVQDRSMTHRAAYARRVGAASLMLVAAVVACAMVISSGSAGNNKELAVSQLYSADGWASLYGGSGGGGKSSGDGWGDRSGSDDTGARNEGLHESDSDDDTDAIFGSSDDPDSSKNDVHWNAADSKSKTATSDDSDDSDDAEQSDSSQKKATSASGSASKGDKQKKAKAKAKGGKPSTTDALLDLSKSFDKGMPTPKSRSEEKKQKAEQLANLLRIQKELSSDYKKVMAKGNGVKNVGKKMGLMKAKAAQHAELNGDPFSV